MIVLHFCEVFNEIFTRGGCVCIIIRHAYGQKLYSCILLVSVSKLLEFKLFANVGSIGPALALEVADRCQVA